MATQAVAEEIARHLPAWPPSAVWTKRPCSPPSRSCRSTGSPPPTTRTSGGRPRSVSPHATRRLAHRCAQARPAGLVAGQGPNRCWARSLHDRRPARRAVEDRTRRVGQHLRPPSAATSGVFALLFTPCSAPQLAKCPPQAKTPAVAGVLCDGPDLLRGIGSAFYGGQSPLRLPPICLRGDQSGLKRRPLLHPQRRS